MLVGIGNGAIAVETFGDFSKGYTHTCPGHSHVSQVYMKLSSHTHVHMDTVHNSQQSRQHKCPSVTEQVDEMRVCRMDWISAIKCGSLVSATRQNDLEDIMLRETRHTQKDKQYYDSAYIAYMKCLEQADP